MQAEDIEYILEHHQSWKLQFAAEFLATKGNLVECHTYYNQFWFNAQIRIILLPTFIIKLHFLGDWNFCFYGGVVLTGDGIGRQLTEK